MGRSVLPHGRRYLWAHATPTAGGFVLKKEGKTLLGTAGASYRKRTEQGNCITVDGDGQWGEDFVWMPRLNADQIGRIEGVDETETGWRLRMDVTQAYPPERGVTVHRRVVQFVQPGLFLLYDRIETERPERFQWRVHSRGDFRSDGDRWRVSVDETSAAIRDLQDLPAPTVRRSEAVATYRHDGTYAHHLFYATGPAHSATFLFALGDDDAVEAVSREEAMGLLELV